MAIELFRVQLGGRSLALLRRTLEPCVITSLCRFTSRTRLIPMTNKSSYKQHIAYRRAAAVGTSQLVKLGSSVACGAKRYLNYPVRAG